MSYRLDSPFAHIEFEGRPRHWRKIAVVWFAFWAVVSTFAVWAYAFALPEWVGFETTVLIGIVFVAFSAGGDA